MSQVGGIGRKYRHQLGKLLLKTRGTISVADAASELGLSRKQAADILGRLANSGWLMRIRRGLYVPVPVEAQSLPIAIEDPWTVAIRAFDPCYISGWSAAEFWGLTDQIFRTVIVVTGKHCNSKNQKIGDVEFILKMVSETVFFGTKGVWREGVKVQVADPSRLIVDIFNDPNLAGGIRVAADIFEEYLKSEHRDFNKIISYAERLGNRTVFKRLGFFAEYLCPEADTFLKACQERLSRGYSQLDPDDKGKITVARWKLRLSEGWNAWSRQH